MLSRLLLRATVVAGSILLSACADSSITSTTGATSAVSASVGTMIGTKRVLAIGLLVRGTTTYPSAVLTYDQAMDDSDVGSNPGIELWTNITLATRLQRSNDNNGQWDYSIAGAYFSNGVGVVYGSRTGSHGPELRTWSSQAGSFLAQVAGNPVPPVALSNRSLVSAIYHACGILTGGEMYCWGRNDYGAMGDGSVQYRASPSLVSGSLSFAQVSGGLFHTCALTSAGAPYCWGRNNMSQVGDGTTVDRVTPTPVSTVQSFAAIAAGQEHACALTGGGAALCWGWNRNGQLGTGDTSTRATPVGVNTSVSFASLTAGWTHTCGLTAAGAAYCWGTNSNGQLGDGSTTDRWAPVAVSGGLTFKALDAGYQHTCGITTAGATYCWGINAAGQLGDGTVTERTSPSLVVTAQTFVDISVGEQIACGRTASGEVFCWGNNEYGQLGVASSAHPITVPTQAYGGLAFASLSVGGFNWCGITTAGAAYCTGYNRWGEVGDGTTADRNSPTAVYGGLVFRAP